jgi:hypothetical protein
VTGKTFYGIKMVDKDNYKLIEIFSLIRPINRQHKEGYFTIWFNSEKDRNDYLVEIK